jgi:RNA polymerase sigma-70 factor (ECF subfamily)
MDLPLALSPPTCPSHLIPLVAATPQSLRILRNDPADNSFVLPSSFLCFFPRVPNHSCHPTGESAINGPVGYPERIDPSDWVDRYGDYLFRYALLRLRDRPAAEDLVQETFLAALKNRETFSGGSSEATWLVGILKHKIADHFRRQAREGSLPDGDPPDRSGEVPFNAAGHWQSGPVEWGANPADLFRQKEFLDQLAGCLSDLSPNQANAFTLREIEGLPTGEICKVLNVTETNLWVILHRARMLLRRCLETRWFLRGTGKGL